MRIFDSEAGKSKPDKIWSGSNLLLITSSEIPWNLHKHLLIWFFGKKHSFDIKLVN